MGISVTRSTAALLTLFITAGSACAHGVGVECTIRGPKVWVYAFYDDGTDAAEAQIRVMEGEREIAKGITDTTGNWVFATPAPGRYQVILDAGAGHRTKKSMVIPDTTSAPDKSEPVTEGQSREEATRYPWIGIASGLGILGVVCVSLLVRRRLKA